VLRENINKIKYAVLNLFSTGNKFIYLGLSVCVYISSSSVIFQNWWIDASAYYSCFIICNII